MTPDDDAMEGDARRLAQLIALIVQIQDVREHQKASRQAEARLDKTVRAIIATLPPGADR